MRWVVIASLLLVPFANAGDASDPEITDPADDAGSRPGMDVASSWVEFLPDADEGASLRFTFKLAGDPVHTPAFFALHEELRFNFITQNMPSGAEEIYVSLRPTCSQVVVVTNVPTCQSDIASCRIGFAAARGEYQDLASEVTVTGFMDAGDQMGCQATLSQLQLATGASVLDSYITHRAVVRGPLSGGDDVGPVSIEDFDRAPDTDFGRDFHTVPPMEPEPEQNVTTNVTTNATTNTTQNMTSEPEPETEPEPEPTTATQTAAETDEEPEPEAESEDEDPAVEESPLGLLVVPALLGAVLWRRRA